MLTAVAIPLENLSNRVVSAYHIRKMSTVLEIALKRSGKNTNYSKVAETLSKDPDFSGIAPGTIQRLLSKVYRKEKILAGKLPEELQEEFLKANPKYLRKIIVRKQVPQNFTESRSARSRDKRRSSLQPINYWPAS